MHSEFIYCEKSDFFLTDRSLCSLSIIFVWIGLGTKDVDFYIFIDIL